MRLKGLRGDVDLQKPRPASAYGDSVITAIEIDTPPARAASLLLRGGEDCNGRALPVEQTGAGGDVIK